MTGDTLTLDKGEENRTRVINDSESPVPDGVSLSDLPREYRRWNEGKLTGPIPPFRFLPAATHDRRGSDVRNPVQTSWLIVEARLMKNRPKQR